MTVCNNSIGAIHESVEFAIYESRNILTSLSNSQLVVFALLDR